MGRATLFRNGNLDLGHGRSGGRGLRAKERCELLADGRTEPRAGIGALPGAIEAVVARDDVGEARLVQPQPRRDERMRRRQAELAAEGGE